MKTLAELEAAMAQLVRWRENELAAAKRMVNTANEIFDSQAIPLGKQINELREREAASKPETTTPRRQSRLSFAGLSDEDAKHMRELLERTG